MQVYFQRAWDEDFDANITDEIPQDLCLKKDQYMIWEQGISVIWIRTWYGNGDSDPAATSREAADAGYRRLWQKGFVDPDLVRQISLELLGIAVI
jgi:hypothetical protein